MPQPPLPEELKKYSFVELKANVFFKDSICYLIPLLIINDTNEVIKIQKKNYYTIGYNCNSVLGNCRFYLRKIIEGHGIGLTTDIFITELYSNDYSEYKNYGYLDCLKDTLNLNNYFPFESGTYQILLQMDYYYKDVKHEVESDWFQFEVADKKVREN